MLRTATAGPRATAGFARSNQRLAPSSAGAAAAPARRAVVAAATLTVDDIKVETPSDAQSSACAAWPIWTCEPSEFPWYYDQNEQCLILEGEAIVTPDGGSESVTIGVGNLVTFPQGMGCTWKVTKAIKKHYNFY